jgi:hypothetical protein
MRRTHADTTNMSIALLKLVYVCNALRFLDGAAIHSGRTRNVAHAGRARRGRGDHLDLYRKSRDLSFWSLLDPYRSAFVLPIPTCAIEVQKRG